MRNTAARRQELRLQRLREAIGGRKSVTPLEVFVGLGLAPHLFNKAADEQIREALAKIGFTKPDPDAYVLPA